MPFLSFLPLIILMKHRLFSDGIIVSKNDYTPSAGARKTVKPKI